MVIHAAPRQPATTLILTYDGALSELVRRDVTWEDLENAVFYMSCTRAWFENPASWKSELSHNTVLSYQDKETLYLGLRDAVRKATMKGRVAWAVDHDDGWEGLNLLLRSLGLPCIPVVSLDSPPTSRYSYPAVAASVLQGQLPYRIVW